MKFKNTKYIKRLNGSQFGGIQSCLMLIAENYTTELLACRAIFARRLTWSGREEAGPKKPPHIKFYYKQLLALKKAPIIEFVQPTPQLRIDNEFW